MSNNNKLQKFSQIMALGYISSFTARSTLFSNVFDRRKAYMLYIYYVECWNNKVLKTIDSVLLSLFIRDNVVYDLNIFTNS